MDFTGRPRAAVDRRAIVSRFAKQRAELRRARIAERWIVFTVASMLVIAMLPVMVVVGAIILVRALWRRYVRAGDRPIPVTATPDPPGFSVANACAA